MQDKVRIGIIGVGGMELWHIGMLLEMPQVEIVAVADTNDARFAAMCEKYPQTEWIPTYGDYREMIERENLDAVEISTPHTLHFQQVMDCLDKGLHVLIEKPMVCRVDHAKELIRKSEEKERVLMVGYQRHYQPVFRYIKQCVESGKLGDVTFVSTLLCQEWKRATKGSWRQDPALSGGGQLNDSGSHQIDVILWATGLTAESVQGYIDNRGCPVDIDSALSIKFTNGAMGTINIIGDAPKWYEDFTIVGTNGAIFFRNGTVFEQDAAGETFEPTDMPECGEPGDTPPQAMLRGFVNAIQGNDINWTPPVCGLRVIELTQAGRRNRPTGRGLAAIG